MSVGESEREREGERQIVCMCVCVYLRERDTQAAKCFDILLRNSEDTKGRKADTHSFAPLTA